MAVKPKASVSKCSIVFMLRLESSVTDEFENSDGALELAVLTVANQRSRTDPRRAELTHSAPLFPSERIKERVLDLRMHVDERGLATAPGGEVVVLPYWFSSYERCRLAR